MRTLEERLTQAGDEARLQVNQIDARSATSVETRQQHRRTLVGAVGVAAMFIVFGASALVLAFGTGQDVASDPSTPPTATAPVTMVESTPETQVLGAPVDAPQLPRLGVVNDDWSVIEAIDGGSGTTLIYEGNPAVYGGEAGEARLGIQIWSDEAGEDPGAGYRHALTALTAKETPLSDTRFPDGTIARTFTFEDSNTGNLGYYFLWQHSDTIAVEVIVFIRQEDQARDVVVAIERLPESRWAEILDDQPADAAGPATSTTVAPGSDGETEWATTTSIVREPQLPPALTGTPLTTAWGEHVVETMAMADYELAAAEIADMDVFEKEMDRGLVHATFTVDGNEWTLAFGPWRNGEYSDDPTVLQEQYSPENPGLETAEGLIFISERPDPSYVYLTMDVGKIVISFQPEVIGSAVPFEDLKALSLDLAPIVRQLLEADLIKWNT